MEGKCPFNGKPCDKAKNVHISSSINGEVSEYNCCEDCGGNFAKPLPFALMPLGVLSLIPQAVVPALATLLGNFAKLKAMDDTNQPRCQCGSSLQDIKVTGKIGCANCYSAFKEEFTLVLPRMHNGANRHQGKTPKNNIETLQKEMSQAVAEERYEDAARLRDRIKTLNEQTLQGDDLKAPDQGVKKDLV